MELNALLFYVLATLTGVSAVAVVVTQNIVRAATWLLFALGGAAGIFFLLGADFIGATQLLIYVGGTLVLVIFGVMLTAQGPFINMRIGAAEWVIGLGVGLLLLGVLAVSLVRMEKPTAEARRPQGPKSLAPSKVLGAVLLGDRRSTPERPITGVPPYAEEAGKEKAKGKDKEAEKLKKQRTVVTYLLPFEIVSVHLLVVLIGAAYLARAKRRSPSSPGPQRGVRAT
jgi:NADH-quinone oxidoreductase subunit J